MAKKRAYTVTTSTGPLALLPDEMPVDALMTVLEKSRLKGAVVSVDSLSRTISVRASIDANTIADAILEAVSELSRVFSRVHIPDAEIVEFAVMGDLPEDEFASARDDIVGTPDVAERLGVSRQRVAQLVEQQGRFPTPIATVRGTHVWRWGDIADWIAAGARDMRRRKPTSEELEELRRRARAVMDSLRNEVNRYASTDRAAKVGTAKKKSAELVDHSTSSSTAR